MGRFLREILGVPPPRTRPATSAREPEGPRSAREGRRFPPGAARTSTDRREPVPRGTTKASESPAGEMAPVNRSPGSASTPWFAARPVAAARRPAAREEARVRGALMLSSRGPPRDYPFTDTCQRRRARSPPQTLAAPPDSDTLRRSRPEGRPEIGSPHRPIPGDSMPDPDLKTIKEYVWTKYVDFGHPPAEVDDDRAIEILDEHFRTVPASVDPENYYLGILLFENAENHPERRKAMMA